MSDTPQAQTQASEMPQQTRGQERITAPEPTGWVGWIVFASMMMILVGCFQAIAGFVALFDSGYYVVVEDDLLVNVDYTAWGWVHLVLGVLAVGTAFGLLAGQMWARVLGIAIAVVSALVNLAFIAAFPVWALTMITLDVLVIYAIAVHGAELRTDRR
jgi:hypothetical protein